MRRCGGKRRSDVGGSKICGDVIVSGRAPVRRDGSADAAAAKAVKTAVSAALPVVGSIVADAASTVTSSAAILRSGIGIVGVVSVAAVCVTPYLQLAVHYVLYKLAAGIAESFADKRVGRLIDGFADVYGFLLGMVGVASLILFLSIVSSMKAVTG